MPAAPYDDGGAAPYRPRTALAYGWETFAASPATLMVPMIVVFVGLVVAGLGLEILLVHVSLGPGLTGGLLVSGVFSALMFLVYQLLAAGLYRGALRVVDGGSFAIRASTTLVTRHLGVTVVLFLLSAAVTGLGALLCGVGLLVTVPVVLLGYAYTFRRLQDQPVVR